MFFLNFDLKRYRKAMRRVRFRQMSILAILTFVLALVWWGGGIAIPTKDESRLWNQVRSAEGHIYEWRKDRGSAFSDTDDPWKAGLIGLEWSPLSTTLGSIASKRTACDPSWSLTAIKWFDDLELVAGDPVVVYSSSSFPGMLLNVLVAAEARGLAVHLVVSLGSSTWGCNDPVSPWPDMANELRRFGYLHTRAFAYTYGGDGETGGGLSNEGLDVMNSSALRAGVSIVKKRTKEDMINWKMEQIDRIKPRLVISIGGSSANMGDDPVVLKLAPGLSFPGNKEGGNGVIGLVLKKGYPVLHLLNLRELALSEGISFDSPPGINSHGKRPLVLLFLALIVYSGSLYLYRRFEYDRLP